LGYLLVLCTVLDDSGKLRRRSYIGEEVEEDLSEAIGRIDVGSVAGALEDDLAGSCRLPLRTRPAPTASA
jgi:hypothetical protein